MGLNGGESRICKVSFYFTFNITHSPTLPASPHTFTYPSSPPPLPAFHRPLLIPIPAPHPRHRHSPSSSLLLTTRISPPPPSPLPAAARFTYRQFGIPLRIGIATAAYRQREC